MTREQLAGSWYVLRGKIQEQWGRLTDDDLDIIDGRHTHLVGRIRLRYGRSRETVEREVALWLEIVDAHVTLN